MPSCEDCYFRQELLCALQRDSVCPTFRATVRSERQAAGAAAVANVVSVTQVASPVQVAAPLRAVAAAVATEVAPVERPVDVVQLDLGPEPFCGDAPEANFSLVEMCESAQPAEQRVVPAREAVRVPRLDPVSLRAAAASRQVGEQCVVEFEAEGSDQEGEREPVRVAVAAFGSEAGRVARVTRRIAERYPNALQLC
jgi:hypothetical protein